MTSNSVRCGYRKVAEAAKSFRRMSARVAMIFAALLLILGSQTQAQTFRGTILGTVMDTSGAAVSGANVTVKNIDTGLTRVVTTSSDGSYSVPELPIGNYSVTVENGGFKKAVVTGIAVDVSTERRADVTLQPGEVAQTVEVTGDTLASSGIDQQYSGRHHRIQNRHQSSGQRTRLPEADFPGSRRRRFARRNL